MPTAMTTKAAVATAAPTHRVGLRWGAQKLTTRATSAAIPNNTAMACQPTPSVIWPPPSESRPVGSQIVRGVKGAYSSRTAQLVASHQRTFSVLMWIHLPPWLRLHLLPGELGDQRSQGR